MLDSLTLTLGVLKPVAEAVKAIGTRASQDPALQVRWTNVVADIHNIRDHVEQDFEYRMGNVAGSPYHLDQSERGIADDYALRTLSYENLVHIQNTRLAAGPGAPSADRLRLEIQQASLPRVLLASQADGISAELAEIARIKDQLASRFGRRKDGEGISAAILEAYDQLAASPSVAAQNCAAEMLNEFGVADRTGLERLRGQHGNEKETRSKAIKAINAESQALERNLAISMRAAAGLTFDGLDKSLLEVAEFAQRQFPPGDPVFTPAVIAAIAPSAVPGVVVPGELPHGKTYFEGTFGAVIDPLRDLLRADSKQFAKFVASDASRVKHFEADIARGLDPLGTLQAQREAFDRKITALAGDAQYHMTSALTQQKLEEILNSRKIVVGAGGAPLYPSMAAAPGGLPAGATAYQEELDLLAAYNRFYQHELEQQRLSGRDLPAVEHQNLLTLLADAEVPGASPAIQLTASQLLTDFFNPLVGSNAQLRYTQYLNSIPANERTQQQESDLALLGLALPAPMNYVAGGYATLADPLSRILHELRTAPAPTGTLLDQFDNDVANINREQAAARQELVTEQLAVAEPVLEKRIENVQAIIANPKARLAARRLRRNGKPPSLNDDDSDDYDFDDGYFAHAFVPPEEEEIRLEDISGKSVSEVTKSIGFDAGGFNRRSAKFRIVGDEIVVHSNVGANSADIKLLILELIAACAASRKPGEDLYLDVPPEYKEYAYAAALHFGYKPGEIFASSRNTDKKDKSQLLGHTFADCEHLADMPKEELHRLLLEPFQTSGLNNAWRTFKFQSSVSGRLAEAKAILGDPEQLVKDRAIEVLHREELAYESTELAMRSAAEFQKLTPAEQDKVWAKAGTAQQRLQLLTSTDPMLGADTIKRLVRQLDYSQLASLVMQDMEFDVDAAGDRIANCQHRDLMAMILASIPRPSGAPEGGYTKVNIGNLSGLPKQLAALAFIAELAPHDDQHRTAIANEYLALLSAAPTASDELSTTLKEIRAYYKKRFNIDAVELSAMKKDEKADLVADLQVGDAETQARALDRVCSAVAHLSDKDVQDFSRELHDVITMRSWNDMALALNHCANPGVVLQKLILAEENTWALNPVAGFVTATDTPFAGQALLAPPPGGIPEEVAFIHKLFFPPAGAVGLTESAIYSVFESILRQYQSPTSTPDERRQAEMVLHDMIESSVVPGVRGFNRADIARMLERVHQDAPELAVAYMNLLAKNSLITAATPVMTVGERIDLLTRIQDPAILNNLLQNSDDFKLCVPTPSAGAPVPPGLGNAVQLFSDPAVTPEWSTLAVRALLTGRPPQDAKVLFDRLIAPPVAVPATPQYGDNILRALAGNMHLLTPAIQGDLIRFIDNELTRTPPNTKRHFAAYAAMVEGYEKHPQSTKDIVLSRMITGLGDPTPGVPLIGILALGKLLSKKLSSAERARIVEKITNSPNGQMFFGMIFREMNSFEAQRDLLRSLFEPAASGRAIDRNLLASPERIADFLATPKYSSFEKMADLQRLVKEVPEHLRYEVVGKMLATDVCPPASTFASALTLNQRMNLIQSIPAEHRLEVFRAIGPTRIEENQRIMLTTLMHAHTKPPLDAKQACEMLIDYLLTYQANHPGAAWPRMPGGEPIEEVILGQLSRLDAASKATMIAQIPFAGLRQRAGYREICQVIDRAQPLATPADEQQFADQFALMFKSDIGHLAPATAGLGLDAMGLRKDGHLQNMVALWAGKVTNINSHESTAKLPSDRPLANYMDAQKRAAVFNSHAQIFNGMPMDTQCAYLSLFLDSTPRAEQKALFDALDPQLQADLINHLIDSKAHWQATLATADFNILSGSAPAAYVTIPAGSNSDDLYMARKELQLLRTIQTPGHPLHADYNRLLNPGVAGAVIPPPVPRGP